MDTEPARQAVDPTTPLEVLADLAYRHPELRAAIAANPATYPDLLEWLGSLGDPDVDRVLENRRGSPGGSPAQVVEEIRQTGVPLSVEGRRFPWPWLIAGAAILVVLVLVAVIFWPRASEVQRIASPPAETTSNPPATPVADAPPARDGSYPGVSTTSLQQLPITPRAVTADYGQLGAVQRFADDVAEGNIDRLIEKCWTFAPATVRDRYGTDQARGAILDAFASQGTYGQFGAAWEGSLVTVNVRNEELESTYACPDIVIKGAPDELNFVDAEYLVTRLHGRLTGNPVDSFDTESNYYLICDMNWELPGPELVEPPVMADPTKVNAAIELLGNHELALRKVDGPGIRDYYILTRLDGSSSANLILQKAGTRVCVGDGSTS